MYINTQVCVHLHVHCILVCIHVCACVQSSVWIHSCVCLQDYRYGKGVGKKEEVLKTTIVNFELRFRHLTLLD